MCTTSLHAAEGAAEAITELNETEYMGRTIRVNEAMAKEEGGKSPLIPSLLHITVMTTQCLCSQHALISVSCCT